MSSPNPGAFDPQDNNVPAADVGVQKEMDVQKERVLKQILEPEARARLNNVRMVRPELAGAVENYLIGAGAQGRLPGPVTDEQLKQILLSAQQPKRDFKINRV